MSFIHDQHSHKSKITFFGSCISSSLYLISCLCISSKYRRNAFCRSGSNTNPFSRNFDLSGQLLNGLAALLRPYSAVVTGILELIPMTSFAYLTLLPYKCSIFHFAVRFRLKPKIPHIYFHGPFFLPFVVFHALKLALNYCYIVCTPLSNTSPSNRFLHRSFYHKLFPDGKCGARE